MLSIGSRFLLVNKILEQIKASFTLVGQFLSAITYSKYSAYYSVCCASSQYWSISSTWACVTGTRQSWMARASFALFTIWKLNWRTYPCHSKRLFQQQWKTGLMYSHVAMEQLGRWFRWLHWPQPARWLERAQYRSLHVRRKGNLFVVVVSPSGSGKTPACHLGCIDPIVEHIEPKIEKSIVIDDASSNGLFNHFSTGNTNPIICIDEAHSFLTKITSLSKGPQANLTMERLCKCYDGDCWYVLKGNKGKHFEFASWMSKSARLVCKFLWMVG